jgi:hypothetical protein
MNGYDIEFLMFALRSVNSPNREEVKAFRENREHLSRLVELTKTHGDELFRVIDQLKGIVK